MRTLRRLIDRLGVEVEDTRPLSLPTRHGSGYRLSRRYLVHLRADSGRTFSIVAEQPSAAEALRLALRRAHDIEIGTSKPTWAALAGLNPDAPATLLAYQEAKRQTRALKVFLGPETYTRALSIWLD